MTTHSNKNNNHHNNQSIIINTKGVLLVVNTRGSITSLLVSSTGAEEEERQKAKMAEEQQEASQGDMEGERNSSTTTPQRENLVIPYPSRTSIHKCQRGCSAASSCRRRSWSTGSDEALTLAAVATQREKKMLFSSFRGMVELTVIQLLV